jgi:transcriptional regulator with PAS, ATPase and Fis domain
MESKEDNRNFPLSDDSDYFLRLQALIKCKERFLRNKEDPRAMSWLRSYVAESWLRSQKYGIDPYSKTVGNKHSSSDIESILAQNRQLIKAVTSLLNSFREILESAGYVLGITDRNGVFLHIEGEETAVSQLQNLNMVIGSMWREETGGTTAPALSMLYKRPVQLLGPEHYCTALEGILGSAAPLLNEDGDLCGTIALFQPYPDAPWDGCSENLHLHSLYLTTAMAAAVEAQMRLRKSKMELQVLNNSLRVANNKLILANNTINTVMSDIDEGFLTVDNMGRIVHINNEGLRIFKLNPDETENRNIQEFLGEDSPLLKAFESGEQVNYMEESIFLGSEEKDCILRQKPIWNDDKTEFEGAVIGVTEVEKVNALANKRSGVVAKFTFDDLLGESKEFTIAKMQAQRFARYEEPILLMGESGTGKELFAQAMHNASRPKGPFIALNCAGMPRELIVSELFGYVGGSFTGADRGGRPGKIELAHEGTLFLDEIGDMPLELQAVFLRVMEDRQVMRIGGKTYKKVDFRIISATNKNLIKMVSEKSFREDLFFRLSVLLIKLPALRDRDNDLNILSNFFVENYCCKLGRKAMKISTAAKKKINEYFWPGNVRQLQNAIIYAVNVAQDGIIEPKDLPAYMFEDNSSHQPEVNAHNDEKIKSANEEVLCITKLEKQAIENGLLQTRYNVHMTAKLLGFSLSTLYRKLKKYNIKY